MAQSISPGSPIIKPKEKEATSLLKIGPIPSQSTENPIDEGKRIMWDEKGRTKVAQMFVSHNKDYIKSIAFQYIEDGELVISPIFGSPDLDGTDFDTLMFGDATNNEYITRLSGTYGRKNIKFGDGVTSLAIETNVATYGPFGTMISKYSFHSDDTKFNFNFGPEHQFGGFHGTSSPDILTSIGVYVKPTGDLAAFSKKTDLRIE